jgi:hypothetical protein
MLRSNRVAAIIAMLVAAATTVSAQPLPPPGGGLGTSSGIATLYTFGNGAGVGNGADTTEDTLLTYNIPAATLKAVGDRIRIIVNGACAGSTDSKTARLRLNGSGALQAVNCTTASNTGWTIYMEVQKIGAGSTQQLTLNYSLVNNGNAVVGGGSAVITDTSPIALTVTGQNSTTATANTILLRYVAVEYLP